MPHLIALNPNRNSGELAFYLHPSDPRYADNLVEVSGELRTVTSHAYDRNGYEHHSVDQVPVEHLEEYIARQYSNAHRDTASGDRAWDTVEVGTVHEDGPGGPNQLWNGEGEPTPFTPSTDPRGGATMGLTATSKVSTANDYIASGHASFLGLTSTAPGSSSGTEISGGSPAYARVAAAWGTPNGVTGVTTGTPAAINVGSGTTVVGAQYWTLITAGTYYDGATVTSQTFATQGTYTVSPTLTPS